MTKEDKKLLLKDICEKLPYGIKGLHRGKVHSITVMDYRTYPSIQVDGYDAWFPIETFKPYLRPMSSMTDEERKEYESFIFIQHHEWDGHGTSTKYVEAYDAERYVTWLNKKRFDYRGLILIGLALEAPIDMYKTE